MSNLDKFDPELLDDEQEFEEDEDAVRAAEAEMQARDKREGREKVTDKLNYPSPLFKFHRLPGAFPPKKATRCL